MNILSLEQSFIVYSKSLLVIIQKNTAEQYAFYIYFLVWKAALKGLLISSIKITVIAVWV